MKCEVVVLGHRITDEIPVLVATSNRGLKHYCFYVAGKLFHYSQFKNGKIKHKCRYYPDTDPDFVLLMETHILNLIQQCQP